MYPTVCNCHYYSVQPFDTAVLLLSNLSQQQPYSYPILYNCNSISIQFFSNGYLLLSNPLPLQLYFHPSFHHCLSIYTITVRHFPNEISLDHKVYCIFHEKESDFIVILRWISPTVPSFLFLCIIILSSHPLYFSLLIPPCYPFFSASQFLRVTLRISRFHNSSLPSILFISLSLLILPYSLLYFSVS